MKRIFVAAGSEKGSRVLHNVSSFHAWLSYENLVNIGNIFALIGVMTFPTAYLPTGFVKQSPKTKF